MTLLLAATHAAISHGEKSGVGLVLAALIPIIGLGLAAGLIYYAVRKAGRTE